MEQNKSFKKDFVFYCCCSSATIPKYQESKCGLWKAEKVKEADGEGKKGG